MSTLKYIKALNMSFGFLHDMIVVDMKKLDGVGPVDNRPSTDKLHHFVQKKEEEKKTCDT